MTDAANEAGLAGARAYEALHVPALFQEWVDRRVDRLEDRSDFDRQLNRGRESS